MKERESKKGEKMIEVNGQGEEGCPRSTRGPRLTKHTHSRVVCLRLEGNLVNV